MGATFAEIELANGEDEVLARRGFLDADMVRRTVVAMLVDTGSYMMAINEVIRVQLDLPTLDHTGVLLADGSIVEADIVGPISVRFANRRTLAEAIVLPGESQPLLGAIPMESMDVLVDPRNQRLIVNPKHPYVPVTIMA